MESIASFFKIENDFLYKLGFEEGRKEIKTVFVKNLLATERLTIAEIASFTNTTEEFVQKIKEDQ